jgi:Rrf2 family protein
MAAHEGASQTEPKGRDQAQVHGRGRVVPDNGEGRREDRSEHPDRKLDDQLRSNPVRVRKPHPEKYRRHACASDGPVASQPVTMWKMRVSVRADYAVRAVIELAAADGLGPMSAEHIGKIQNIPLKFLQNILAELKQEGIVTSERGPGGGFVLARDPSLITLGQILRVADGPLARVADYRPDQLDYSGHAAPLRDVWVAVRAYIRDVLDEVTVAQVCRGELPLVVTSQSEQPDAWLPRIKLDLKQGPQLGVPGRGGRQGAGRGGAAGPVLFRAPIASAAGPTSARRAKTSD